jgi:hypothetical protein
MLFFRAGLYLKLDADTHHHGGRVEDEACQTALSPPRKRLKTEPPLLIADSENTAGDEFGLDLNRTGAKCVAGEAADPQQPGTTYHRCGALRTKPGRGDRTLSLSCSDKILKWTQLGCQVPEWHSGAFNLIFVVN